MSGELEPRLLMVPPTFYRVEYEINPWMDRLRPAGRARCSPSGVHRLVSEKPLFRRGETDALGYQSPAWAHRTCE